MTRLSLLAVLALAAAAPAQTTYTWDGPASGNTFWGAPTFWNPDVIPGTLDTAIVPTVAADRSIEINVNSPPAGVAVLDLQQSTAGALNQLVLRRSWTITAATTLTASAGTAEFRWSSPGTGGSFTLTLPNGLTVAAGGRLSTGPAATGLQSLQLGGNLAQTGGEVSVDAPGAGQFSGFSTFQTSTYALSGGTFTLNGGANGGGSFSLGSTLTATGGTVQMGSGATLRLNGATNTVGGGTTFQNVGGGSPTNGSLVLGRENAQSLTADTPLPAVVLLADQSSTKTLGRSSPSVELEVQSLTFQGGSSGQTLSLGSNIRTYSPAANPLGSVGSGDRAVALNGRTLDFTFGTSNGVWTPNGPGAWSVTTNPIGGRVRADGFDFSAAGGGVTIGANVVLESFGGGGVTLNLTNAAASPYSPTSLLTVTGSSVANPAVLTTNRTLGRLEVTGSFAPSGLRLDSPATLAGNLRIWGASQLLLNGVVLTFGGSARLTTTSGGVLAGTGTSAQVVFGSGATGGIDLNDLSAPFGALTLSGTFASTAVSLADTSSSPFDISATAYDQVNLSGNGVRYGGVLAVTLTGSLSTAGPTDFPLFANVGSASNDFSSITLAGGNSNLFTPSFNPTTGVLTLTPVPEPGLVLGAAAGGLLLRRVRRLAGPSRSC